MTDRLSTASISLLRSWPAPSAEQRRLEQDFRQHLQIRDRGWSRDCAGAHLTASSLVCAPSERRVLLTLHAKLGRWLQTGGHIEPGDLDLPSAALREACEESGLEELLLDPQPLLLSRHEVPCGDVRPCFHLDVQFLVTGEVRAPSISAESHDVAWFGVDDLPATDQSVRDLVAAAGRRLGWA